MITKIMEIEQYMEKQREVTMQFVFDDKVIQEEQNFELCFLKIA